MNEKEMERVLKSIANKRRLDILRLLKKGEHTVSAIAEKIHLSIKSTSRHLAILVAADVLGREQRSVQVFYRLADPLPKSLRHFLAEL